MPTVAPCLPNPSRTNDPNWSSFGVYLRENNISQASGPALDAYQMASSGPFLSASQLNHCLALWHFGAASNYAGLARDLYGDCEEDWGPIPSLDELDALFSSNSYHFAKGSIVFKGIGRDPFYDILDLANRLIGEEITFSGFLSTSVCREKAESFARGNPRLLLQIDGLNCVSAVIPPIRCVPNSPTPAIPEQEVLLNRGCSFTISKREELPNGIVVLHVCVSEAQPFHREDVTR